MEKFNLIKIFSKISITIGEREDPKMVLSSSVNFGDAMSVLQRTPMQYSETVMKVTRQ